MKRTFLVASVLCLLCADSIMAQENQGTGFNTVGKTFSQPSKVYIASSPNKMEWENAKECVLLYLEEAMNDTKGELLVTVRYILFETLYGEIEYPPTSQTWYFRADWKMTTKGNGYYFQVIKKSEYDLNAPYCLHTLN